ncbi:MAG: trans-sulfuration enzyme family protein [Halobacteriales archaeon]
MDKTDSGFSTRSIHAGEAAYRRGGVQDVVAPIHLSSTFKLDEVPVDTPIAELDPGAGEYLYSRLGNPTRQTVEARLAVLTGAEHAFALASGSAAVSSTVLATVRPGESVVAFDDLYGGSVKILDHLAAERLDVEVRYVDARDPANVEAAVTEDTSLVLMESPTNPLLRLCDIEAIADVAHDRGATFAVDNTFATPYFQRPLELGADVVIHSTTKYLNGHSDGIGGAVATSDDDLAESLAFLQRVGAGNAMAPVDAYLLARGMKTLEPRMEYHERNALGLARHLEAHEHVRAVHYPGLPDHPQHDLAASQMDGFGGVVSFELAGDLEDATRFVESLETFTLAVSLGGVESLVELPAAMTHDALDPEARRAHGLADTLVRASVGIEDLEDLRRDLERGFEAAFGGND